MTNQSIIYTAKIAYVRLMIIHEPVGLNGGELDQTRWDLGIPKVRKAYEELKKSIITNNFLVGVIAVQLPEDVTLFERHKYKKGHWLGMDVNGRIRVLKDLINEGYTLNPDTDIEGQVPVIDVTKLVLTEGYTVTDDIVEKLWDTLKTLNTGQLNHTDYDFISTGSRVITNPEQKPIWTYLANQMKKYHLSNKGLSNKVVLAATIHILTDTMKRKSHIPFNMEYKRYSDIILKRLLEIRMAQGSSIARAPFLRALANYLREASYNQSFFGVKYAFNHKGVYEMDIKTKKECFSFAGNLYEDEHFMEFKRYLDYISLCFEDVMAPNDGFAGTESAALKQIHEYMLKFQKKWDKKGGVR